MRHRLHISSEPVWPLPTKGWWGRCACGWSCGPHPHPAHVRDDHRAHVTQRRRQALDDALVDEEMVV